MNRMGTLSSGKVILDAKGIAEKIESLSQAIAKEFGVSTTTTAFPAFTSRWRNCVGTSSL